VPAVVGVPDACAASTALALVAIPSFPRSPARYLAGTACPRFELADRDEDEFAAAAQA
jgi:hypothetical protein